MILSKTGNRKFAEIKVHFDEREGEYEN